MITSAVTQVDSVPICHYMHEPITMMSPNRLCNPSQHVFHRVYKEPNLCCNESPFVVKLFLVLAILLETNVIVTLVSEVGYHVHWNS